MMLHPCDNPFQNSRRHMVAQSRFSTFAPNGPSCVAAYEAAGDGERGKKPWISAVRHKPKQQQVGASGQRQRNHRGIDYRNGEKPERSHVREPMRHRRMMRQCRETLNGLPKKASHAKLNRELNFGFGATCIPFSFPCLRESFVRAHPKQTS